MTRVLRHRVQVLRLCASVLCLWLGVGPLAAAVSVSEEEHDCCCAGGSACQLSGCSCGGHGERETSPCGGVQSSNNSHRNAAPLSFVRQLGVSPLDATGLAVLFSGSAVQSVKSAPEVFASAPESPPPRLGSAC